MFWDYENDHFWNVFWIGRKSLHLYNIMLSRLPENAANWRGKLLESRSYDRVTRDKLEFKWIQFTRYLSMLIHAEVCPSLASLPKVCGRVCVFSSELSRHKAMATPSAFRGDGNRSRARRQVEFIVRQCTIAIQSWGSYCTALVWQTARFKPDNMITLTYFDHQFWEHDMQGRGIRILSSDFNCWLQTWWTIHWTFSPMSNIVWIL